MKLKLIILLSIFLVSGYSTKAQLLDKLKERAKEKGYQTRDVSFDSTDNAKNRTSSNEAEELVINSAKDFFTTDVIMKLYYETNAVISTQYFDADVIAMRTEFPDPTQKPLFQDRKGLMYAYNEKVKVYEKASIAPSSYMGFMMAGMIPKYYKLPAEPYLEAFGKLQEKDITLSFLALELAFVYKPSDFEDDSYYTPSKTKCNTSNNCTKFSYNDPEYPGSYILFDDQGRLSELYTHTTNPELGEEDHPIGKFVYTYKDVTVKLPDAVEKSMMTGPFKMLKLERGLEPWKYNKKDKQKN